MVHIDFRSRFHPVGHGLFYSGEIFLNEKRKFTVVYDCGSTKGKRVYEERIDNSGIGSVIDLLIISHFHKDHINGIEKLLENRRVKEVVMPYINNEEKVYQLLCMYDECRYTSTPEEIESLANLISNPISFFSEKADNISFIVKGGERRGQPEERERIENIEQIRFAPTWTEPETTSPAGAATSPKTKYYNHTASLIVDIWQFVFYINEPNPDQVRDLNQKISNLGITMDNFMEKFGEIKSIYASIFSSSEQNSTSIVCSHGSLLHNSINHCHRVLGIRLSGRMLNNIPDSPECCDCFHHLHHCYEYCIPGTCFHNKKRHCCLLGYQMLTGDAPIKNQNEYKTHFREILNHVFLFQIPHHGSRHNWKDWFIEAHPNSQFWICTNNSDNKYRRGKFPSADFYKLITSNRSFFCVTENPLTVLDGNISIF